jgi:hypothetical protein
MFFKKPKATICAVCGSAISANERRFVDKNKLTKAERHTHLECQKRAGSLRVPPS